MADIREARCYDSLVGAGTEHVLVDDERVVDATHSGSLAHLINHSCEPNCYSRLVAARGKDRILIFAIMVSIYRANLGLNLHSIWRPHWPSSPQGHLIV